MAVAKTTTKRRKSRAKTTRQRKFLGAAARAAVKGGAGFAIGATCGAVEVGVSKEAARYTKGVFALVGLAAEIWLDPLENPVLSEGGKAALYTSTGLFGEEAGKKGMQYAQDKRHERNLAALQRDLASISAEHMAPQMEPGRPVVEVPARRPDLSNGVVEVPAEI